MTYQEKIIRFLQLKQDCVNFLTEATYCEEKVWNTVSEWSNKDSKKVWEVLVKNIKLFESFDLSNYTCPFCLYYLYDEWSSWISECKNCAYGEEYGICYKEESFFYICFKDTELSNKIYINILNEIEEEEKENSNE